MWIGSEPAEAESLLIEQIGGKRGMQGGMGMLMGVVWDVSEYPGHMEPGPERKFLS